MITADNRAYQSAKTAYMIYGWLVQETVAKLGWERAMALQSGVGTKMGESLGQMVRQHCEDTKPTASGVTAALDMAYQNLATDYELKITAHGATATFTRCPIHDGLAASGMKHEEIRKVCEVFTRAEAHKLHDVFPTLKQATKVRERSEDICVEEFVITP